MLQLKKLIPDKWYICIQYYHHFGKFPDLKNPKTFNEKLQWLKIYDRKPEYTVMVDKYLAKKYVADAIGEEYIIPTLGVWEKAEDIEFERLPDQFVLKTNHNSGGIVICKDKSKLDYEKTIKIMRKHLKWNGYWYGREWPYKNVKPCIIAEQYMEDKGRIVPEDYKIYCMNGEPKYIVVFHNRFDSSKELSETVYDINWQPQHISLDEHFAISDIVEPKPDCLDELLDAARILCKGIPQVRVDFYIIEGRAYFGEITLYTASGFQKMIPEEIDLKLGKLLQLPSDKLIKITHGIEKMNGGGGEHLYR